MLCPSARCHAGHELAAAQGDFYCECGLHVHTCCCLSPPTASSSEKGTAVSADLSLPATVSSSSRSYSEAAATDVLTALLAECGRTGRPWVDASFPHSAASLFIDPGQPHQPSWLEAEWVRVGAIVPQSALFSPPMSADDIRQGQLGNCWFLSALAVLTLRQSLVFACFVAPAQQTAADTSGVYAVRFFREGQQRVVLVDDCIPALRRDDGAANPGWQPLFAQQREGGHSVWSLIIEKGASSAAHTATTTAIHHRALAPP